MPIYLYQHPQTQEVKEIIQRMNETHEYTENGIQWQRIFIAPNGAETTVSNLNPFDKKAFMEKTGKMRNITQGDLWDISADLSKKRERILGKDPIKEKTKQQYSEKCGGIPHPLG